MASVSNVNCINAVLARSARVGPGVLSPPAANDVRPPPGRAAVRARQWGRKLVRNTTTKSESGQRRSPAHRVSTYDCGVEVDRDAESVMRKVTLSSYRTRDMVAPWWGLKMLEAANPSLGAWGRDHRCRRRRATAMNALKCGCIAIPGVCAVMSKVPRIRACAGAGPQLATQR